MNRYSLYKKVKIDFAIPGFDMEQQGLIVNLQLVAIPSSHFRVKASGSIAKSLEGSFIRVIEIMSSLNESWNCLESYQYTLKSFNENYRVKDTRSADLSLCIVALNVVRNHKQMKSINRYIGTGTLRIDGSFNQTLLEAVKEKAALESAMTEKKFVNAKRCNHIFELEDLLNSF
ncbi:hypothetical protein [Fluoribacter gormanii]|uniref:hypothetical protein n=1 Tax=Fluoribacter gormanii TaxID=464 RepID=UPI001041512A|nr:hypothetical protein [Fluoribacter gormanii]